jgi:hypothetical protein
MSENAIVISPLSLSTGRVPVSREETLGGI